MDDRLLQSYEHCGATLYEADRDRYLATLFAPQDKRRHLVALYALAAEVSGIREKVSDPMPGQIRLQWWMDVLDGRPCGEVQANPIAHAVTDTISRFGLPAKPLIDMVDARIFDLFDDPMPTMGDLVGYAGETCSALMQMSAIILNDGEAPCTADIAGHGGVAHDHHAGSLEPAETYRARTALPAARHSRRKRGLPRGRALARGDAGSVRRHQGTAHERPRPSRCDGVLRRPDPAKGRARLPAHGAGAALSCRAREGTRSAQRAGATGTVAPGNG